MLDKKKKYGIIALVVIVALCILLGIHEHNKPISPVVGSWSGNDINLSDGSPAGHANVIKLQTYNDHTFKLEVNDNSTAEGKYSGKWEKTNDVNNDGDPIYALRWNHSDNPDGYDRDEDAEYFTLGGQKNVIWIGPNNNQHLQARLHKIN